MSFIPTCLMVLLPQIEDGGGHSVIGEGVSVKAEYFSFNELTCRPPAVGSYLVSVSNNGVNASQELLFTVYSSVCQECSETGVCTFEVSACGYLLCWCVVFEIVFDLIFSSCYFVFLYDFVINPKNYYLFRCVFFLNFLWYFCLCYASIACWQDL